MKTWVRINKTKLQRFLFTCTLILNNCIIRDFNSGCYDLEHLTEEGEEEYMMVA